MGGSSLVIFHRARTSVDVGGRRNAVFKTVCGALLVGFWVGSIPIHPRQIQAPSADLKSGSLWMLESCSSLDCPGADRATLSHPSPSRQVELPSFASLTSSWMRT
jgi:hypothetical protein